MTKRLPRWSFSIVAKARSRSPRRGPLTATGRTVQPSARAAGGRGEEAVALQPDGLGGERGEPLDLPAGVSRLDDDVLAVHVSKIPKPVRKGGEPGPVRHRIGSEREIADPPDLSRRLSE